ncbi:ELL-associated factor 2-like [Populus alba x Populus x berolinensis]|uniref:ELL-associated factor 2-like n=1 Tax=Populus alba x Populus x berolinensis TaxID=444605 RepID=A0AAD6W5W0_9ROSI|nr:ELL-associated factor 2-like [Populus alba x Populus x berolinensis]
MVKRNSTNEEPNTAPEPDRWYDIKLGSSFQDQHNHSSPKFCTLRYEFKPASIDKSQPGLLHKSRDNRVSVEYHNNQQGKPNVMFEGVSEDYKENDAVLFFDGDTFHLEQLHHAVKRLRHVRLPGESAAATATVALVASTFETRSPPVGKAANSESLDKGMVHQTPVQMEQIGTGVSESLELEDEKSMEHLLFPPNLSTSSPDPKNESEEQVDIVNDDDDGCETANKGKASEKGLPRTVLNIDINLPHQAETDDEIADVDISDDDIDKGPNAAEALKALNAEGMKGQNSSSSGSSGSDSSGSESGSSSSDSESSGGDSVFSI